MSNAKLDAIIEKDTLGTFVETFQAVVSETVLEFSADGVYGEPQDPATVALVNQTLKQTAFESYETSGLRTGINLDRLDDFLSKADGELVHIRYDDETRKLNLRSGRADFTMACIDPDAVRKGVDIDDWDFLPGLPVDITVDAAAFEHAVGLVDLTSDHLVLSGDPSRENPVHVIGEGDTDDMRVRFGSSLHEGSEVAEACESIFSHEYMERLMKVVPKSAALRIRFGDEWPTALEYEYADGHAEVSMGQAPRIQSN